jgi:hypothetical protein
MENTRMKKIRGAGNADEIRVSNSQNIKKERSPQRCEISVVEVMYTRV